MLIFADTETTWLKENKLIQLALMYDAGLPSQQQILFNPWTEIEISAMATHHITPEMVKDKPTVKDRTWYWQLKELLECNTVVAHNAKYDLNVLRQEWIEPKEFICTMKVAMALYPELESHSLQYLRYYFNLKPVIPDDLYPHHALYDTIVMNELYMHLLRQPNMSERKMIEISKNPLMLTILKFGKYKGEKFTDVAQKDKQYLRRLYDQEMAKWEQRDTDLTYTLSKLIKP